MTKTMEIKSKSSIIIIEMLIIIVILTVVLFTSPKDQTEIKMIIVPEDYPTIQEAINNAGFYATILVNNGVYSINETIVINKTLSIIGEDSTNTIIRGIEKDHRKVIAIRVAAPDVTISGFTITDCRVGITIVNYENELYPSNCKIINNNIVNNCEGIRSKKKDLLISENKFTKNGVAITGFNTENIQITRNNITGNEDGINIGGTCKNITVNENQISNNEEWGLNLCYYGPHYVFYNTIMNNSWGIIFAEGCSNATVCCNSIVDNDVGAILLNFPNAGDIVSSGVGNIVSGNLFINNTKQVSQEEINIYNYSNTTQMGIDVVFWNNSTMGNYWSNYNGTDTNGDGIGDAPYVIDANNQDNYPLIMAYPIIISPESMAQEDVFPTFLVVASALTMAVTDVNIMHHFKKHKRKNL